MSSSFWNVLLAKPSNWFSISSWLKFNTLFFDPIIFPKLEHPTYNLKYYDILIHNCNLSSRVSINLPKLKFDHYISLGCFCLSSSLLNDLNLKHNSFPFDWIFSSFELINEILEYGCQTLLEKTHYISTDSTENEKYRCSHSKWGLVFNHHDPSKIEHHYNYLKRCCERFENVLSCTEDAIFLNCTRIDDEMSFNVLKLKLCKTVELLPSGCKLVVFLLQETNENSYIQHILCSEKLCIYKFCHESICTGVNFDSTKDNTLIHNAVYHALHI